MRTPLSGIIGMAGLLPDDEIAQRIRTSAESLLAIIGDILDFSKIDSRKLTLAREPLALRAVLQGVVEALQVTADEKGLTLILDIAAGVPDALVGDALRLRQILINLVGNAIKFTQAGSIRVRADVASMLPGEVCLHLAVIDTGSGTVTATAVITDGYHQRIDLTNNGQLFIGSRNCTNIGNAYYGKGDYGKVIEYCSKALSIQAPRGCSAGRGRRRFV